MTLMQQVARLPHFQEEAGSFLAYISSQLLIFHLKSKLVALIICASHGSLIALCIPP